MKQNMKRLLLLLSMITCFFVLSGCAKTEDSGSEEVTAEMEETLVNGSRQYLAAFAAYSDEEPGGADQAGRKGREYCDFHSPQLLEICKGRSGKSPGRRDGSSSDPDR